MTTTISLPRRTATALVAAGIVLGSAGMVAPTALADTTHSVTGGQLEWGLKDSFRSYITGPIANGEIQTSDGVTTDDDGNFIFPATTGTEVSGDTVEIPFQGTLHFTGHGGILDLTVSDVKIRLTDQSTDAMLVADAVSKEFVDTTTEGDPITYSDVDLASVTLATAPDLSSSSVDLTSSSVALTSAGAPAFGGFWEAGQELNNTGGSVTFDGASASNSSSGSSSSGSSSSTKSSSAKSSSTTKSSTATGSTDKELAKTGTNENAVAAFGLGLLVVLGAGVAIVRRQTING